jgi:hypothetical protein
LTYSGSSAVLLIAPVEADIPHFAFVPILLQKSVETGREP